MSNTSKIIFGEWLPDLGPTNNPGVLDAFNVFPHSSGYRPVKSLRNANSLSVATTITASQVFGGAAFLNDNGNPYIFIGTTGKIWGVSISVNPRVAVDLGNASISNAAVAYQTFARYGSLVIWTNKQTPPQKSTLTTSATTFAALGGTPPTAQFVAVVRDFVVFANTTTSSFLLQWSALGNPEDYVASAATQSDSQLVSGEGPIIGLVGGEYGIIFFADGSIYRMTYIGAPVIFQFDKIVSGVNTMSAQVGAPANIAPRLGYTYARLGDAVYFLLQGGLAVIYGGQQFRDLSIEKNSAYLKKILVTQGIGATSLGIDPSSGRIHWGLRGVASSTHTIDIVMVYNYNYDKFTRISTDAAFIINGIASTQVSDVFYVRASSGGQLAYHNPFPTVAAFVQDSFIETADIEHIPGQRAFVNAARPIVNHLGTTGTPMLQVGTRERQNVSISYSTTVTVNAQGETPQRAAGRFHRYKLPMSISASWSYIMGVEVDFEPDGDR